MMLIRLFFLIFTIMMTTVLPLSNLVSRSSHDVNDANYIQYSSINLRQYSHNTTIARSVRKRLFKHHIWKPVECLVPVEPRLQIPVVVSSRSDNAPQVRNISARVLTSVQMEPHSKPSKQLHLSVCSINVRSVKNKTLSLSDYMSTNDYDIIALTETWLSNDCKATLAELVPPGYNIKHVPRQSNRNGGGVAIVYKDNLQAKITSSTKKAEFTHFEHLSCLLTYNDLSVHMTVVYRPPPSQQNKLKNTTFFNEWPLFLETFVTIHCDMYIVGDMNFHLDVAGDANSQKFIDSLQAHDLIQHVKVPTHQKGHTLDVVITRNSNNMVEEMHVTDPVLCDRNGNPSGDHYAIHFRGKLIKPASIQKCVSYRKLRNVNITSMKQSISNSELLCNTHCDLEALVRNYNDGLRHVIDNHAPVIKRIIHLRPNAPWYNEDLKAMKLHRRTLEKQWHLTGLTVHHEIYRNKCVKYNNLLKKAKSHYYSSKIKDCGTDTKEIYRIASHLMGTQKQVCLPSGRTPEQLSNEFNAFFTNKIATIREQLCNEDNHVLELDKSVNVVMELNKFSLVTQDYIIKMISQCPNKSCLLDPIPTWMLKECIDSLAPIITVIINKSLSAGLVPKDFKIAHISPLLKKAGLDSEIFKFFRPISNLSFISKLSERIVDEQLNLHVTDNKLYELLQSAYKKYHSTETALIRIQYDIAKVLDEGSVCVLILLDLSAAFDTIDHQLLLSRLEHIFGIKDKALSWIRSYLEDRYQCVLVNNCLSDRIKLQFGVPQGSVLGPKLFSLYMKPLGDLIRTHDMSLHFYADDTQLYMTLKSSDHDQHVNSINRMENCIKDVRRWMSTNMLKLNDDKTELIVFSSRYRKYEKQISLHIGNTTVYPKEQVKNLGVILDKHLTLSNHINNVSRNCYASLRQISHIRRYITTEATKTLVQGLVMSKLDYCNALYNGLPDYLLNKLQRVQNLAARIVTYTAKYDKITPVLRDLHWLPVCRRIEFKTLLYVYKILHREAPEYLQDLVSVYKPSRSLRSATSLSLVIPRTSTSTYGNMLFPTTSSTLWNQLPVNIKQAPTSTNFKKQLKTHIFKLHYNC